MNNKQVIQRALATFKFLNEQGGLGYENHAHIRSQIENLEAALAQPEPIETLDRSGKWLTVVYKDVKAGDEVRQLFDHPKMSAISWSHALNDRDVALSHPTKEPVAWIGEGGKLLSYKNVPMPENIPVYAEAPKREWKRLTDNEIINTADSAPFETMVKADDYIYIIARAIEKLLKEKNHG